MTDASLGRYEVCIGNLTWRILDLPDGLRRAVDLLRESPNVDSLKLELGRLDTFLPQQANAGPNGLQEFANWIVESPSLDDIAIYKARNRHQPSAIAWDWLVATIHLKNVQGATKLTTLTLEGVEVPANAIASLIGENSYLQGFRFECNTIQQGSFPTEALAARHVAQSFASNSSISRLYFCVPLLNDAYRYFCAILNALPNRNAAIDTLTLMGDVELHYPPIDIPAVIQSIVNFFQEAGSDGSTLRCVVFKDLSWSDEEMLPILRSLRGSPRQVEKLRINLCRMDSAAVTVLHSLFAADDDQGTTTGTTLRTLSVEKRTWLQGRIHPDLIQNLVGTSPNLHTLDLFEYDAFDLGVEGKRLLKAVFRGLQVPSCAVQTLKLGTLENLVRGLVIRCIPTFCSVTSFSFETDFLDIPRWNQGDKKKLMKAFRRNTRIVEANLPSDFFDESDHAKLQVYLERNRRLAATIHSQAEALEVAKLLHREDGVRRAVLLPRLLVLAARSDMPPSVFGAMVQVDQTVGL